MASNRCARRAAIVALAAAGLAPLTAPAQVKYFDKPPSVDALRQALTAAPAEPATTASALPGGGGGGPSGRGIQWNAGAMPAAAPVTAPDTAVRSSAGGDVAAAPASSGATAAGASSSGASSSGATVTAAGGAAPAAALPINFDLGSARVSPSSIAYIDAIAQLMQRDASLRMVIEGHTDSVGAYGQNMMLSWDRAMTVFRMLVERYGIDPARLQPIGRGPLEPMPGAAPTDGINRRVQFRIAG